MRVAFFGGTFDPIHRGHLRLAAAAADAFGLDRILFAPVGQQPLKAERPVASFPDRLEMTALAIASGCVGQAANAATKPASDSADPRFTVSTLDAPRADGKPNFTIDTLDAVAHEYPTTEVFVLTGADSFLNLRHWRSPDRLLAVAKWIVVSRPEFPLTEAQLASLTLSSSQRERVHLLTTVHEDVSATELRRRLRTGDPCYGMLPDPVAAYIQGRHLYR